MQCGTRSGAHGRPDSRERSSGGTAPVLALLALLALVAAAVPFVCTRPAAGAPRSTSRTVWLCRPGVPDDPCAVSRTATTVSASGTTASGPATTRLATADKVDCFYVYPTVSREPGLNADLTVQPAETATAEAQASQFSRVCDVWAPMYRQTTDQALVSGAFLQPKAIATSYDSLLAAWKDYLAHDNHGRRIVFIGHSQGAAMLIKLLRSQIDPSPRLRRQLVSAILLGGNVQVATGRTTGGSFTHIPLCTAAGQAGCVIAYSTFGSPPVPSALFGRPGQGVSLQSGQTTTAGQHVACVNPATLSSAFGNLVPMFPTAAVPVRNVQVTTPWTSFAGLYRAQCQQADGATWLQVTTVHTPGDPRPKVQQYQGPLWGYHVDDVNLALGNLVADVAAQETAAS